jgi:hypothetical protein
MTEIEKLWLGVRPRPWKESLRSVPPVSTQAPGGASFRLRNQAIGTESQPVGQNGSELITRGIVAEVMVSHATITCVMIPQVMMWCVIITLVMIA